MRKSIVLSAAGVLLAISATGAPPRPQSAKSSQQVPPAPTVAPPHPWVKLEATGGAGVAVARPAARMAWVAAVNVPGQTNFGEAGFKLSSDVFQTGYQGATATATFAVQAVSGLVSCKLVVQDLTGGTTVASKVWSTTTPGTQPLTTTPYNRWAGRQYQVWATILVSPGDPSHPGGYATAGISDLKFVQGP